MAVRLEIGWHPDLADAEGEAVRRQAREYFGLDLTAVRVLRVLMLDVDLPPAALGGDPHRHLYPPHHPDIRFRPPGGRFPLGDLGGFKPGVRDTAGAVAFDAIAAYLGRPLPPGAAVYTSKLFLLTGEDLTDPHVAKFAQELLANDMVQEFRRSSHQNWDAGIGLGI